jgi:hypothetical protein
MVKKSAFRPFQNEADCLQIGEDLTIENRIDRVSIFGSVDITFDKAGLLIARQLKEVLDLTLAEMEKTELPEKIALAPMDTVDNPFE